MKKSLIFQTKINNWNLKNKKLLIGVSGGVDSMTLLFSLFNEVGSNNLQVMHVNYMMRGKDNEIERDIVRNFCETHNIKYYYFEYPKNYSVNNNFQNDAREYRYKKAHEIYSREKLDYFVTAHNQNDFLETYFIKKLQKRDQVNNTINIESKFKDMKIIRPMLSISKANIIEFAKASNIIWNEDYTNNSNKYLRNRIRKKLNYLYNQNPLLFDKWQSKIVEKSNRNEKMTFDLLNMKISEILNLDEESIIYNIYKLLNQNFIYKRKGFYTEVLKLLKSKNNYYQLELNKTKKLVKNYDKLQFFEIISKEQDSCYYINTPKKVVFNDKIINFNVVMNNVLIRYIKPGDKIKKTEGTKRLAQEFRDKKIEPWKRDNLIVIEVNSNIVFVEKIYENNKSICVKNNDMVK